MRLVRKGKAKDIFELANGNLMLVFSDRISAFDVRFNQKVPNKGKVLCNFASYWFEKSNIASHFIRMRRNNAMEVKKLSMIPYEFIVRGYYYGSMLERYSSAKGLKSLFGYDPGLKKGSKLPYPIFEITTKSEEHDTPVQRDQIDSLTKDQLAEIERKSLSIYEKLSSIAGRSGFIIADVKLEYGFDEHSGIILGDSIGPDEFRIWLKKDYEPGRTQPSYDKQILRDWLIEIGFKDKLDRLSKKGEIPRIPRIPKGIISQISNRYMFAYKMITRKAIP